MDTMKYTTTCDHGKTWNTLDPLDPAVCAECKAEDDRQHEQEWAWEAEQDRKIMEHEQELATRDF